MVSYEWVCDGCGLLIDGPNEEQVATSVRTHKWFCIKWQEWQETTGKYIGDE